jgi:hypothetical protein
MVLVASTPPPPLTISVTSSPDYLMDILTAVYVALTLIIALVTIWSVRVGRKQSQDTLAESRRQSEASLEVAKRSADGVILTFQEMKEARDQDTAPYIVAYFDVELPLIYFVVKNLGKSVAEEIRLDITPPLTSSEPKNEFNELPFIKDGIGALAPGSEIRIFFDSTIGYFREYDPLPLRYDIAISYHGGLQPNQRSNRMILDLSTYKGTGYFVRKDFNDLVKSIEELVREYKETKEALKEIAETLKDGLLIKNPELFSLNLNLDMDSPLSYIVAKLKKFRDNWQSAYPRMDFPLYIQVDGNIVNQGDNLVSPHEIKVRNECLSIGNNVSALLSIYGAPMPEELVDSIEHIAVSLSKLGNVKLFKYSNNVLEFNELGDATVRDIDDLIRRVESTRNPNSNHHDQEPSKTGTID